MPVSRAMMSSERVPLCLLVLLFFGAIRVDGDEPIRVGIIGLDTSHALAFAKLLNAEDPPAELAGCPVVAAYPQGSPDIESSTSRIPKYTEQMKELGVVIVDSIDALLPLVDVVLLETNDGRPHLEQLVPVLRAGKRTFIDKPIAGSLTDVLAIFEAADHFDVPIFSASSLRYGPGTVKARSGAIGSVVGCDTYSPCSLEPTHPDFFWYGVHGVESLFTVMGTGCQQVTRVTTKDFEMAVGVWSGGRIGSFRGIRSGAKGYGGRAFGERETIDVGDYGGYEPLVVEIVKFFRGGKAPVDPRETIEIFAFMEAADESKRQEGRPVDISEVLDSARRDLPSRRIWEEN